MFQGTQKILAIAFSLLEAAAYTLFGAVQAVPGFELLIIAQLALGGILLIFLDEVVSKWGFGSGVSLFIAAGVSKRIIIAAFNPQMMGTLPAGKVVAFLATIIQGSPDFSLLLPIIATLVVFAIVVYAQAMKVEIPLAFGSIRGFGRKWPLKFIYASVIPVILVSALLINLKVWGSMLASKGYPLLGRFDPSTGNPISGIIYYLNPPHQFIWNLLHFNIIGDEVIRVVFYTLVMVVGSAVFAVFWVNTAGMSAKNVAKQIQGIGMQIPGFRRDPRIIERVLDRYIPPLAVLGGAFIGFLAAFADFTGALAGGTSILLAVMIIYNLYEEVAMQHMEDMHPMLRKFIKR
jgi:preprotein translocase subunit SecY